MSAAETDKTPSGRRRIRNTALALMSVALAFYFGIIALLVYRGTHH
ncbi:MAG TPA: hypothetical protein VHZ53_17245 [Steroidobacteraceae bacterium]|jgi:hypothetical protein|nr:hypothetical protein [Steroidobacteraceae bacterium]